MSEPIDVLRDAFLGLLSLAPAPHQQAVLRRAITLVMATDEPAPSRSLDSRSPPIDTGRWQELRTQIRATMELRKMGFAQLAAETAMSRSSLEHILAPSGSRPGQLIAQQLETWLARQSAAAEPEPIVTEPPKPQAPTDPPKPAGPRRLSGEERSILRDVYGDMDERELRKQLHCTSDLFERALTGAELPAEAVSRFVGAIAHRLNGVAAGALEAADSRKAFCAPPHSRARAASGRRL